MTEHPTDAPLVIYTIGHGNAPVTAIIELLHKYAIRELVDVRSVPYSQYVPAFNREAFKKALEDAGIVYAYAGDYLGGRPKDETCYKTEQVPDEKTGRAEFLKLVDYAAVMERPWYQKGIARLIEIARTQRTAIMCSEEAPDRCHRSHLIAQTLIGRGITARHIRRTEDRDWVEDEQPRSKQLSLF